jgi:hypothetical protein
LFADSVRTFGEACEGGRQNVYALYSSQSEYAGFTTIGDPEMNVWTGTPCSLLVTHPAIIPTGTASFAVNVSPASSSVPMDGAIVCVMSEADSTIYVLDTADVSGNAQFTIYPQLIDDTIHVTVTGRNLQPYEGEMVTIQPGLYVSYYASTIDDTLGGNGDNLINPNEDINMPLWVKNLGTNTATDVIGILRTSDSYTVITDSIRSFGTMLVNQVCSTGAGGYRFSVAPNAPDGHMVNFDLVCRDINDSSWTSAFEHMIYAPNPAFHEASISGGNGNSTLEPGETVDLVISIKNNGRASLDSADATLQSLTPEVIVLDSIAFFPIIDSGGIGNNSNDPFVIMSDSNITPGTTADLKMTLTSSNCLDTILFSLPINTSIEETNGQNTTINEPLDIYPNPGRGAISINLSGPLDPLHENAISIYDVCGNMVRQYSPLSDKQILNWVGDDEQGRRLPEGVYFVRFTAGNTEQTYKVVLLE